MYRALLLACCAAACDSATPPSHGEGDGSSKAKGSWPSAGPPGREPDLARAQFFARSPGSTNRQPLKLGDFAVQVKTGPQVTRSQLSITVANPSEAQVEAFLRLPIPPGAAVTRAVLHVGQDAVEGAFVARERALEIYRSITERRRDPALITWSGPDFIEASVFPVERTDIRTLELEWLEPTATRDGAAWYRVPVISNEGRDVRRPSRITVDGVTVQTMGRQWLPLATIGALAAPAAARGPGEPFGYVFAPAQARKPGAPHLVVVAETSRAMLAAHRQKQRAVLEQLFDSLPDKARVTLLGVDWAVAAVAENATPAAARATLDHLDGIASAGALDLESALLVSSSRARAVGAQTIVFVGPATDSFKGDALAAPLRQMQEAGQSLVVIGGETAPIADAAALTGGQSFPWSSPADAVARLLAVADRTPVDLTMANAERFFPLETVTGETRWLARFVGAVPQNLARSEARALEALWTRAHVAATSGRDTEQGVRHRVLTPLTSILVLESMADYQRWGIAAPERPDGPPPRMGKVEARRQAHTGGLFGIVRPAENVLGGLIGNDAAEAYGVGGLGLVGTGTGDGGTGEGTLAWGNFATLGKGGGRGLGAGYGRGTSLADRHVSTPRVVPGQPNVRGPLDREIIRRIIRLHLNEVKYCYDTQLARRPTLAGRVAIQFVIASSGQVVSSVVQSTTVNDTPVESCLAVAVRRWEFPRPAGGGIVIVSYPFTFIPNGDPTATVAPITADRAGVAAPPDAWTAALATLHSKEAPAVRLGKVATAIGAPATDSPAVLAWWIVERHLRSGPPITGACILAANLLREANRPHEAIRILSEGGEVDLPAITAELRRWNSDSDVKRLDELAARK